MWYQTIIIEKPYISATLEKPKLNKHFKHVTDLVYREDIGIRNLAYKLQGFKQGYYFIFTYESEKNVGTLKNLFINDENILKFVTVDLLEDNIQADIGKAVRVELSNKLIDAIDVLLGRVNYM